MGSNSLTRDWTWVPALGARSLSHWTTRDLKFSLLLLFFFFFLTFWLHHEACLILVAQPGIESTLHAVEAPEGNLWVLKTIYWSMIGLPWLKESACNAGGPGFDPWVGNIPWRRDWLPTPVFLPGKSCGQRSLAGYRPWGHRVRHGWATNASLKSVRIRKVRLRSFPTELTGWK